LTFANESSKPAKAHTCKPDKEAKLKLKQQQKAPVEFDLGHSAVQSARECRDGGDLVSVPLVAPHGITTERARDGKALVAGVAHGSAAFYSMQVKVAMEIVKVNGSSVHTAAAAADMLNVAGGETVVVTLRRRILVPARGWAQYKRREKSTRRTAEQLVFLWKMFNSLPRKSHFTASDEMRTVSDHGLKFKPQLWLAASQIKSWFSKKASEKKKATSVVLLGKFQAQAGAALAAFQKDAAALDDSSDDSGSESGE
jgi:hypothetical protein